jgi:hypothetical protein
MMDPLLLVIVAIAALTGYSWYQGNRTSRMVILAATTAMERAFQPVDSGYTNIGGTVGYHFSYSLKPPFRRMEGTVTTVPRHALFYLPIALWLLKREDLLLFTLYCEHLEAGQGYIVEKSRYEGRRIPIEDRENLHSTTVSRGAREFVLLWYNPLIRDRLSALLKHMGDPTLDTFLYLGYYGQSSYLAVTVSPVHPGLDRAMKELSLIFGELADGGAGL